VKWYAWDSQLSRAPATPVVAIIRPSESLTILNTPGICFYQKILIL